MWTNFDKEMAAANLRARKQGRAAKEFLLTILALSIAVAFVVWVLGS